MSPKDTGLLYPLSLPYAFGSSSLVHALLAQTSTARRNLACRIAASCSALARAFARRSRLQAKSFEYPSAATAEPCLPRPTAHALVVARDRELGAQVASTLAPKYQVTLLESGEGALERARELRPDLIVSDIGAGRLDGFALCRALRTTEVTRSTPLLLLTARGEPNDVSAAFAAGASDCVETPFHPRELAARADVHVRLQRLTEQLSRQERLAALGCLAASVAHNVRNPLSAMLAGLPALRRRIQPHLDGTAAELMDVMVDCAERIERTTLDLLDLSRIDRDGSGRFAPGVGLLACTRMFGGRLSDARVVLETDVDVVAVTSGRAGEMTHVFMNVIDNALRAVPDGGRIQVRGAVEDGHYAVTIGDSGSGIEPAALGRVFEPFWTTRPAGEGTGLGLSIARQIVEEHGGTIAAGRSPLGGAEFTIRLPLREPDRAVA